MPFTVEEFFQVFARYNTAVWPAQWLLALLAAAAVGLATVPHQSADRIASAMLAILWLWMGVVYHWGFFADINPAARAFGFAFVLAALVFGFMGTWRNALVFHPDWRSTRTQVGAVLMAYALVGYPVLGMLAGHHYPAVPTFGAPCPTTIFTLGLLLWVRGGTHWPALTIPLLWAVVGTVAAVTLGVPQDYGLAVAALAVLVLSIRPPMGELLQIGGAR